MRTISLVASLVIEIRLRVHGLRFIHWVGKSESRVCVMPS